MASVFVAHLKILADLAAKLFGARLLRIEMVETRLARDHLAILCELETLCI